MSDPAAFRLHSVVQFDRAAYDRMDEETDGAASDIVAIYLDVMPSRRADIGRAADEGNLAELERLAHMVKSGARSVGLARLGALCAAIEKAAADKTINCALAKEALIEEFDAAAVILRQLGQSQQGTG